MTLLEYATPRKLEDAADYATCSSLLVKERRTWLTTGARVIEGRVWRHAEIVIEAKHSQWDRENCRQRVA